MTVTLAGTTLAGLTAFPSTYTGSDVSRGLVARSWAVKGLVTDAQLAAIYSTFDSWRAARLSDNYASGSIGSTVLFSATLPAGSVTNLAVWFEAAPTASAVGNGTYHDLSFTVIDAAQAIAIAGREKAPDAQGKPSFGTFTWGGVTLTLTQEPNGFVELPKLTLSASGSTYLSGPLVAQKAKKIVGETDAAGWAAIRAYIESISESGTPPSPGDWWPVSAPTAIAEIRGASVVYVVTLDLAEVL